MKRGVPLLAAGAVAALAIVVCVLLVAIGSPGDERASVEVAVPAPSPIADDSVAETVRFDLFLGSGFLIKDCGDNGVDVGDGIRRGDIIVRRKDDDLHVSRANGNERVICTHFFDAAENTDKAIRFADGSTVGYTEIIGR